MKVSESYYEDEVRDGYYVSGTMKRVWAAQIEVLEEVGRICRKYGLQYFADWGTLLGAVRHRGYIPWDDDLDICMKREDYYRFQAIADKELSDFFEVFSFQTDEDNWNLIMRVISKKEIRYDQVYLDRFHGSPFAVGIDIFPLDYLAPDQEEEEYRDEIAKIIYTVANEIEDGFELSVNQEQMLCELEQMCNVRLDRKQPMKLQLYNLMEQIYSLYSEEEAEEITQMPNWIESGTYKLPKYYYQHMIMLPFEKTLIPAPAYYDEVLKKKYGNYMDMVRKGGSHDYPFYLPQKKLLEKIGIGVSYRFTSAELESVKRPETKKEKILRQLEQLIDHHQMLLEAWNAEHKEEVYLLLEKSQNFAVEIGNIIEEKGGERSQTVQLLERYCENIYQIYLKVETEMHESVSEALDALNKDVKNIRDSMEELKLRNEIVFLPFQAKLWNGMDSEWRKVQDDPYCDVYVIPIPYARKDIRGVFQNLRYEGDQFPAEVPVTYFNDYDFEKRCPDVIYIQNPFDEYNPTISVHPFFYSKNLKKYTRELVYIPYFVVDEIPPEDERGLFSLNHFVTVPGVIHADRVLVQSEQMKQTYINKLVEFAGEETRELWEKKIEGTGLPIQDKPIGHTKEEAMPEQWKDWIRKEDGSYRKVILYCTSPSTLLSKGNKMLEKMRSVFRIFEQNKQEVTVIWCPHPSVEWLVKSKEPKLWEDYCDLVDWYQKEGIGIYDTERDEERLTDICDAYYGDNDSIMVLCRRKGKPMMIQNVDIID